MRKNILFAIAIVGCVTLAGCSSKKEVETEGVLKEVTKDMAYDIEVATEVEPATEAKKALRKEEGLEDYTEAYKDESPVESATEGISSTTFVETEVDKELSNMKKIPKIGSSSNEVETELDVQEKLIKEDSSLGETEFELESLVVIRSGLECSSEEAESVKSSLEEKSHEIDHVVELKKDDPDNWDFSYIKYVGTDGYEYIAYLDKDYSVLSLFSKDIENDRNGWIYLSYDNDAHDVFYPGTFETQKDDGTPLTITVKPNGEMIDSEGNAVYKEGDAALETLMTETESETESK